MSFLKKKAFATRVTASRTTKGRPPEKERKDAAELIAGETDCGRDIIRYMVNTMKGITEECTPAVRLAAATWLGNYFFGKPVETTVQLSMSKTHDSLPSFTDEQLEDILRGGLARVPQGLLGGDTPDGPGAGGVDDGNTDVGVQQVQSEVLQPGTVEGESISASVPAVGDGPSDGDAPPGPSDGPANGSET